MEALRAIAQLPPMSVFYALLAGLFLQACGWAHLIGTGALSALIARAGMSGDYDFLERMTPQTRDRIRAGRLPALVLAAVTLVIAVVVAVAELAATTPSL